MQRMFAAIGCVGLAFTGCTESPSDTPSTNGNGNGTAEVEPAEETITPESADAAAPHAAEREAVTERDVEREVGEAISTTTKFAAQTKDEYVQQMQNRLDELDGEVAELEQKAADLSAAARAEWDEQLQALKKKRRAARGKLDELKSSSQDAWRDFRGGVDDAWVELTKAFDEAAANFE